MYALVDCNNFFVSCERVFRPDLCHRPVLVMSNNDGCAISRSNEVKKIGIPMGAPIFKYRDAIKQHNVQLFSPNFELYGELSNRVVSILRGMVEKVDVYSIDEAFLNLSNLQIGDAEKLCLKLRERIWNWVGIPVSVGIAPTRTLAKLAVELCKTDPKRGNVFDLSKNDKDSLDKIFGNFEISDVWGVGSQTAKKLKARGIATAYDLKYTDLAHVRRLGNVSLERTYHELNGVDCIEIHHLESHRRGIASTRSFGHTTDSIDDLHEAVANYVARAAQKLRRQKSIASFVTVNIRTSVHVPKEQYFSNSATIGLNYPTDNTSVMAQAARNALGRIFRPGIRYKKAGVYLSHIEAQDAGQLNLLEKFDRDKKQRQKLLSNVLDSINRRWGTDAMHMASQGIDRGWQMKSQFRSPSYTSSWDQLREVG